MQFNQIKQFHTYMNTSKLLLLLFCCTFILSCGKKPTENQQRVNAVIGDISYTAKFDSNPDDANENLRIQTHLKYVEQVLRSKNTANLSKEQKENRIKMLNLLKEYWANGVFPKNYDYPNQRIPCFIDKNGIICAVGYLIEKTAGRDIAEAINSKFKYEYLMGMKDQVINNWIEASGLTKIECAMIQPNYGPYNNGYISPRYGITSSLVGGLNLSLNTMNIIQISKTSNNKTAPIIGLFTGASQIILGATTYPKDNFGFTNNYGQRNLSLMNIGLGATTVFLSSYNLIVNRNSKIDLFFSYNPNNFATPNNNMGMSLNLIKRL